MKTIQVNKSIEKELESLPRWKLMLYLQNHGEASVYQISKALFWTTGKAHALVNSLLKSGTVRTRTAVVNGRTVKLVKLAD